jgi:hypothetical protein
VNADHGFRLIMVGSVLNMAFKILARLNNKGVGKPDAELAPPTAVERLRVVM